MSSEGRNAAPRLEATYEVESASIAATRIPWAASIFVLAIAGTGLVEYFYRPDRLTLWTEIFVAQLATLTVPFLFRKHLLRRQLFEPVIILSWSAVISLMTIYALSAPLSSMVLGYGLICIMTGASLLAWWRTTTQAVLVVICCLAISAVVVARGERGIDTTLMLFSTFAGGLISLYGNRYFEIHRRAILVESLRSENEASINCSLEDFAKQLNRGLSDQGVEDRIAALARASLGARWVLVLVRETAEATMNIVGGNGSLPTALDNLKAIDLPTARLSFLEADDQDARIIETWSSEMGPIVKSEWNDDVLMAPLRHRGEQIGAVLAGFEEIGTSAPRLLNGIAQHASIAIANSKLMDQLRRASTMKSEFLATMSHELRTPLHVIMGYTEMLDDMIGEGDDPEVRQILQRLQQNEKSLTDLIEGTLDAHRLEAGRNVIKQMKFESKALFEQIKLDTRWLPRTPGVRLEWDLPDESTMMLSDPTKVKVIVKNLIGNALKFTKRGRVRVSATLDPCANTLAVIVSDSGPGIPEAEIPHIFEMFRQASPSAAETALGGVGLGLFIVREFSVQLGGTVHVENNEDGGARFRVSLPLEIAPRPKPDRLVA